LRRQALPHTAFRRQKNITNPLDAAVRQFLVLDFEI
jgi:hypothetical protein